MENIFEVLEIAGFGLIGIFSAILVIYGMILLLSYAFPTKKRIRRLISRKTGEIIEEIELELDDD